MADTNKKSKSKSKEDRLAENARKSLELRAQLQELKEERAKILNGK